MVEAERVRQLFIYKPETGEIIVRSPHWRYKKGDKIKSRPNKQGYLRVSFDGKRYLAHRVAFLYMVGRWPNEIDHINHIKTDNRWSNLREVDRGGNMRNTSRCNRNTSGVTGVVWCKQTERWSAIITENGKFKRLGRFEKKSDAIRARKQADKELDYHVNHGREHV